MSLTRMQIEDRMVGRHRPGVLAIDSSDDPYQMKRYERYIECTTSTALGGDLIVNLPPVGECAGLIFTIWQVTCTNTTHVYVLNHKSASAADGLGDDAKWPDCDLHLADDFVVVYSNGRRWFILDSEKD